ncbi:MAG: hypothetical protein ABL866_04565 [Devosia sp.]
MSRDYPPVMRAFHESLMESQYWPRERMVGEQHKYLEQLVKHAREHVPFYAKRLDVLMTPGGGIDWDRWQDIPIVTRKDALEQNEALISQALPSHQGPVQTSYTSGSTGTALRVVQSQRSNMMLSASLYRAQRWFNLDWSRDMLVWFGEDPASGTLPDGEINPPWGPPWEASATGRRFRLNRYLGAADVLNYVGGRDIGYLSGRPAALHALALEALRLGIDVKLDAILTFSTGVRPDEREDYLSAFGARAIVPYSAKEGQFMAHQCPTGEHYHINDETVLVEIVDDEGRICPPGATGRVVVTPLYNYAQPLIRYDQGDLAVTGGPCACGRTLGVIASIAGRTAHLFRFPDGRNISMSLSVEEQRKFGARYWQIAQVAPLVIEVRYVPAGEGHGDAERLTSIIRTKTHPDVKVKFSRRADLNRADGRKFIEYVYEVDDSGAH